MVLISIQEFVGRLHPLLVHLPIGILLIALLIFALSVKEKYKSLQSALPILFLLGTATALFSCITGYLLSVSDDYDESLVNTHMWMGIIVTLLSAFLYLQHIKPNIRFSKTITAMMLVFAVSITGHLGGSLTHGSDYLSQPLKQFFTNDSVVNYKIVPLKNAEEAMAYQDVIKPILATKCYSCHNTGKQKGSLRMDDTILLMKGGKNGTIIDLKDVAASEMLQRLHLPVDNEHHMPPKEKPQLTENQITLIHWWISNGADFSKKVKALKKTDKIKTILTALQQPTASETLSPVLALKPVEKGDEKAIAALKQKGIIIEPVAQNSNYLFASFVINKQVSLADLKLLSQLKKQLISLKINNTNIDDKSLPMIAELTNLIKLDVSNTQITDAGLSTLKTLNQLQYLNLVGNNISEKGLLSLKEIKTLTSIFLYKTNISVDGFAKLKSSFPKATIDTGGYTVPTLATDTTVLKYKY